jgi:hypothetical protein
MAFLACAALWSHAFLRRTLAGAGAHHPRQRAGGSASAARWPFQLLFIEMAAFYFQAASPSCPRDGLGWADGYTLQYYLLDEGVPAAPWVATSLPLCHLLSVLRSSLSS